MVSVRGKFYLIRPIRKSTKLPGLKPGAVQLGFEVDTCVNSVLYCPSFSLLLHNSMEQHEGKKLLWDFICATRKQIINILREGGGGKFCWYHTEILLLFL